MQCPRCSAFLQSCVTIPRPWHPQERHPNLSLLNLPPCKQSKPNQKKLWTDQNNNDTQERRYSSYRANPSFFLLQNPTEPLERRWNPKKRFSDAWDLQKISHAVIHQKKPFFFFFFFFSPSLPPPPPPPPLAKRQKSKFEQIAWDSATIAQRPNVWLLSPECAPSPSPAGHTYDSEYTNNTNTGPSLHMMDVH